MELLLPVMFLAFLGWLAYRGMGNFKPPAPDAARSKGRFVVNGHIDWNGIRRELKYHSNFRSGCHIAADPQEKKLYVSGGGSKKPKSIVRDWREVTGICGSKANNGIFVSFSDIDDDDIFVPLGPGNFEKIERWIKIYKQLIAPERESNVGAEILD